MKKVSEMELGIGLFRLRKDIVTLLSSMQDILDRLQRYERQLLMDRRNFSAKYQKQGNVNAKT